MTTTSGTAELAMRDRPSVCRATERRDAFDERRRDGGCRRAVRREADPDEASDDSRGHGHVSFLCSSSTRSPVGQYRHVVDRASVLGTSQHELDPSRITKTV
jgi:hypothetical protein